MIVAGVVVVGFSGRSALIQVDSEESEPNSLPLQ